MPQENPKGQELQRSEEEERKSRPRKETKEAQEEVGLSLATAGLTQDLIEKATTKCAERIEAKTFNELEQANPELVAVIRGVAEYFNVPVALLCATFYHESNFKHGLIGDPHLPDKSKGIGQFRKITWSDLMDGQAKEFKEFRQFIEKFYPGKKFDRGENLLADIAATAAYLKYCGGKKTDFDNLPEYRIIYLRARYIAGSTEVAKAQMQLYIDRKYDQVSPKLREFFATYKRFKTS